MIVIPTKNFSIQVDRPLNLAFEAKLISSYEPAAQVSLI